MDRSQARRVIICASSLLLLAAPTLAHPGEVSWPSKGDTVYISATLKSVNMVIIVFGAGPTESDVPPCVPMLIKKSRSEDSLWETKDPVGLRQRLEGAWPPRMHKTEGECKAMYSAAGEPRIVRNGWIHKIVPQGSATQPVPR
jgi:hypothetical protein